MRSSSGQEHRLRAWGSLYGARTWLLAHVLALGLPALAQAQVSAARSGVIEVAVVSGLTILVDQGLDFGIVAQNSGTHTIGRTSPLAAHLRLSADRAKNVQTTITPNPLTALQHSTIAGATLPFTLGAAYNNNADDAATATVFPGVAPFTGTLKPGVNLPGGKRREGYIYLYGSIDTNGNPPTGLYTGVVTITAAY